MKTNDVPKTMSLILHMVATYKSLRRLIVGVAVTFLVLLLTYRYYGNDTIPRYSISAYYHNQGRVFGLVPVRDLFVGTFSAVALMLYAYKGYTWRESQLLNLAGAALLGVVVFPMEWAQPAVVAEDVALSLVQSRGRVDFIADAEVPAAAKDRAQMLQAAIGKSKDEALALAKDVADVASPDLPRTFTGWAHYICAFVFFFGIAWVCWFHADDTLKLINDPAREARYKLRYGVTSFLMALVPVLATVLYVFGLRSTVFWVEFAGVGVFILYWSIKSWELSEVQLFASGEATPSITGV